MFFYNIFKWIDHKMLRMILCLSSVYHVTSQQCKIISLEILTECFGRKHVA